LHPEAKLPEGLLMLQKDGHQNGFQGGSPGGIAAFGHMKSGRVEEGIETSLVFPRQGPTKFLPVLKFLLNDPAERQNGSSHSGLIPSQNEYLTKIRLSREK
jgi:hypothetical protein